MGFIMGLLIGLLIAIVGLGLLAYFLCTRPNNMAVARFINGIAQALATKPKASGPGANGEAPEEAGETPRRRW